MVSDDIRHPLGLLRQVAHEVDPKEFFGHDAARLTEDAAEVTHKEYEVVSHNDGSWDLRAPPDEAAA